MQEGDYDCTILDAGLDEDAKGQDFAWLEIRPDGHASCQMKLFLIDGQPREISEANLRSLGWLGAWVDGWENEVINKRVTLRYGTNKKGYTGWSFPYRAKKNSSVLERLSVTQPARPKAAPKAAAARQEATKALAPAPAVADDDVPF